MSDDNPLLVPPRQEELFIYPPAIEQELAKLNAELAEALAGDRSAAGKRAASKPKAIPLAEKIDELTEDAKTRPGTRRLLVQQVPNVVLRRLVDAHPPRKGNEGDKSYGFDESKFFPALLRASLVEPEVTDEQFAEFVDQVPTKPWNRICAAAYELALGEVELPKSSAVSAVRRVLALGSERPLDSE